MGSSTSSKTATTLEPPKRIELLTFSFSDDATISVALSLSNDGVIRAVATLIKQLALQASLSGQSIKADDFSINTMGRGKNLLDVAMSSELQATREEEAAAADANAGEFVIVNTRLNPQASPLAPRDFIDGPGF
jgi:hypothetical protein